MAVLRLFLKLQNAKNGHTGDWDRMQWEENLEFNEKNLVKDEL